MRWNDSRPILVVAKPPPGMQSRSSRARLRVRLPRPLVALAVNPYSLLWTLKAKPVSSQPELRGSWPDPLNRTKLVYPGPPPEYSVCTFDLVLSVRRIRDRSLRTLDDTEKLT